jgi:hypothetical protein
MSSVARRQRRHGRHSCEAPVRGGSEEAGKAARPYPVHGIMRRKIGVDLLDAVH